ncbi:hypothetical protein [Streptomyces sioyaensis]|uniref:hypothetical protein n=1 Tax=Streptomyces sioyaensis TaxID=67364 RepID=UPI0037A96F7C
MFTKVEDVYIDSLGAFRPEWASAEQAVADGILDAEIPQSNGLTGVHVGGDIPAMDMAVSAARTALERSKLDIEAISLHIHSSVNYQGPVGTYSPGYIMREPALENVPRAIPPAGGATACWGRWRWRPLRGHAVQPRHHSPVPGRRGSERLRPRQGDPDQRGRAHGSNSAP